jgi:hypothetical protein
MYTSSGKGTNYVRSRVQADFVADRNVGKIGVKEGKAPRFQFFLRCHIDSGME